MFQLVLREGPSCCLTDVLNTGSPCSWSVRIWWMGARRHSPRRLCDCHHPHMASIDHPRPKPQQHLWDRRVCGMLMTANQLQPWVFHLAVFGRTAQNLYPVLCMLPAIIKLNFKRRIFKIGKEIPGTKRSMLTAGALALQQVPDSRTAKSWTSQVYCVGSLCHLTHESDLATFLLEWMELVHKSSDTFTPKE